MLRSKTPEYVFFQFEQHKKKPPMFIIPFKKICISQRFWFGKFEDDSDPSPQHQLPLNGDSRSCGIWTSSLVASRRRTTCFSKTRKHPKYIPTNSNNNPPKTQKRKIEVWEFNMIVYYKGLFRCFSFKNNGSFPQDFPFRCSLRPRAVEVQNRKATELLRDLRWYQVVGSKNTPPPPKKKNH